MEAIRSPQRHTSRPSREAMPPAHKARRPQPTSRMRVETRLRARATGNTRGGASGSSGAGALFRPRRERACALPAISTYALRREAARAPIAAMARIVGAFGFVAALVMGAACLTRSFDDASAAVPGDSSIVQTEAAASLTAWLMQNPIDACSRVQAVLQGEDYPSGCEPASLACALTAMGAPSSIEDIIACLDMDASFTDFVEHYAGDPSSEAGSAWPPAMVNAANRLLDKQGNAELVAIDISGTAFAEIMAIARAGYPILVWTTVGMDAPDFADLHAHGQRFVRNNHCVVVYGQAEDGTVLVMDPLVGLVQRNAAAFARIYEARGSLAVVVAPRA